MSVLLVRKGQLKRGESMNRQVKALPSAYIYTYIQSSTFIFSYMTLLIIRIFIVIIQSMIQLIGYKGRSYCLGHSLLFNPNYYITLLHESQRVPKFEWKWAGHVATRHDG